MTLLTSASDRQQRVSLTSECLSTMGPPWMRRRLGVSRVESDGCLLIHASSPNGETWPSQRCTLPRQGTSWVYYQASGLTSDGMTDVRLRLRRSTAGPYSQPPKRGSRHVNDISRSMGRSIRWVRGGIQVPFGRGWMGFPLGRVLIVNQEIQNKSRSADVNHPPSSFRDGCEVSPAWCDDPMHIRSPGNGRKCESEG